MAYRKYMFDLDFDPPPARTPPVADPVEMELLIDDPMAVEDEEDEPPPPTFTEEDLQLVRESAFAEGYRAGQTEALDTAEGRMTEAMSRLAAGIAALDQAQAESAAEAQRVASRVAMAVLRKILPAACEEHAFEEVVRTVVDCLGAVLDEPRIIVRVVEELVDPVRERLDLLVGEHGFEGRVVVQADARLPAGDCRVEWTDGGAERDQARLIADIEAAVARALAPPERDATPE